MPDSFGKLRSRRRTSSVSLVDPTTNIAQGTFLVGSGNPIAAEIRDRMEMQIDISTEHSTFFQMRAAA